MQNCTTILGVIDMRQRGISYDDCRRYGVGNSTVTLIMSRYKEIGQELDALKQLSSAEVEQFFYLPENVR